MDLVSWGFVAIGVMYLASVIVRSSAVYEEWRKRHDEKFPPYQYWREDKR